MKTFQQFTENDNSEYFTFSFAKHLSKSIQKNLCEMLKELIPHHSYEGERYPFTYRSQINRENNNLFTILGEFHFFSTLPSGLEIIIIDGGITKMYNKQLNIEVVVYIEFTFPPIFKTFDTTESDKHMEENARRTISKQLIEWGFKQDKTKSNVFFLFNPEVYLSKADLGDDIDLGSSLF